MQASSNRIGGMPAFILLWLGQLISVLASMMTNFALTIWAFEDEVVEEINARHANSVYLKGFELPGALRATRSLEEASSSVRSSGASMRATAQTTAEND